MKCEYIMAELELKLVEIDRSIEQSTKNIITKMGQKCKSQGSSFNHLAIL